MRQKDTVEHNATTGLVTTCPKRLEKRWEGTGPQGRQQQNKSIGELLGGSQLLLFDVVARLAVGLLINIVILHLREGLLAR